MVVSLYVDNTSIITFLRISQNFILDTQISSCMIPLGRLTRGYSCLNTIDFVKQLSRGYWNCHMEFSCLRPPMNARTNKETIDKV